MALTDEARAHVTRRLAHLERVRDRVVMDGDTHPTDPALIPAPMRARMAPDPGYFHTRPITGPELLAELDMAGVDMALSWQNPAANALRPGSAAELPRPAGRTATRGMQVSRPDQEAYRTASRGAHDAFYTRFGDNARRFVAAVQAL